MENEKMKNIVKSVLCILLLSAASLSFAAKKSIVCVTFPGYDWVLNILGGNASKFDVSLLQDNGTDLHSYQPSVKDLAKVSKCDMLVYVGGESDEWVEKAVSNARNKSMVVVNMMEVLGDKVKEEEVVEGMQAEDDHDHDEHEHGEHDEHEVEYDEHVWLSLRNAAVLTGVLSEKIQALDSANAAVYKSNASAYAKKLSALDEKASKIAASAAKKTVLFGDRYPFRYFTDDYGLEYFAAFVGCSAESEASFETVVFLSKKVDELGLNAVLTIEKSDKKIAKTVVSNTKSKNQKILEMDSLQSITKKEIKAGRNYLSAMEKNIEVLKTALN
nr:zinc ABC transporter substrate-binding protein [Treponema sp.]